MRSRGRRRYLLDYKFAQRQIVARVRDYYIKNWLFARCDEILGAAHHAKGWKQDESRCAKIALVLMNFSTFAWKALEKGYIHVFRIFFTQHQRIYPWNGDRDFFLSAEWRIKRQDISRRYSRERYCRGTCEIIVREIERNKCVYKFRTRASNGIRLRFTLSCYASFFFTPRTWNLGERKIFKRLDIIGRVMIKFLIFFLELHKTRDSLHANYRKLHIPRIDLRI